MDDSSTKEAEQSKINTLILNFAKTEANVLKFSECLMLLIDRCVFNHKFTISKFCQLFESAQMVKNQKPLDKESLQGERIIGREQFVYILNEIAKILFKYDPHYQQKFFKVFLSEKIDVDDGQVNFSRVMSFDDTNRKLLTQDIMTALNLYEEELRNIYITYMIQNYFSMKKSRRLLLSYRQILLQNKRWTYTSLILFLKQSETTPHLTTIEHMEDSLRLIVPNINSKQQQFYNKHIIFDTYQKQNENTEGTSHAGDPGLMFHEFLILIARIAWDTYPRELQKNNPSEIVARYFKYILIRKNQDIKSVSLPDINRKMITKLRDYYKVVQSSKNEGKDKSKETQNQNSAINALIKRINTQIFGTGDAGLQYGQILKVLQKQLPKMPPLPKVEQQAPPPYKKSDAFTIGMQPPPEPVDKGEKIKLQKKNDKKDDVPARVFQWDEMPQIKTSAQDHLKGIESKLTFQVQPLSDISRGTIKRESYPVIIGQTLFPGELPKSVAPYLKQALNALNNRNFVVALQNYEIAIKTWKKTHVEMDASAQLFFEYSKGSVFLSVGKLDHAFQAFYDCRRFSQTSKLPYSNPDRSLPYFGLGEVLFEMREYELSARSFLKSRQIREGVLGIEHVQTATVFNNLACCFFMLGRSHESLGYIQIAEVVFDTELGEHHERTMTGRLNLKKIDRGSYDNQPSYRKFWEVFEEDKFEKKKKKKKADDKKKK